MGKDPYRRGSSPIWFVALALVLFALYSVAVAVATAEDCDGRGGRETWRIFPPEWKCYADP